MSPPSKTNQKPPSREAPPAERRFTRLDNGYWLETLTGPNGRIDIDCVPHSCADPLRVLGRYHFHGKVQATLIEERANITLLTFIGNEGADYPDEAWEMIGATPPPP